MKKKDKEKVLVCMDKFGELEVWTKIEQGEWWEIEGGDFNDDVLPGIIKPRLWCREILGEL